MQKCNSLDFGLRHPFSNVNLACCLPHTNRLQLVYLQQRIGVLQKQPEAVQLISLPNLHPHNSNGDSWHKDSWVPSSLWDITQSYWVLSLSCGPEGLTFYLTYITNLLRSPLAAECCLLAPADHVKVKTVELVDQMIILLYEKSALCLILLEAI